MQPNCPGNDHSDHHDHLVFDSKQTAWLVSAFLLLLFVVFMVGYFLGKHQAVEQFSHALDQESISDKIYSSLYASYEGKTGIELAKTDTTAAGEGTQEPQMAPAHEHTQPGLAYYAPLIGFGSHKAAQAYAHRLIQRGFPVELKQRTSNTAKGRVIHWYQIITKPFASQHELEKLIAILEKQEHLTNIKIATLQ